MPSHAVDQCSLCKASLNCREIEKITTACGHTYHGACAQVYVEKSKKVYCPVCREPYALAEALDGFNAKNIGKTETNPAWSRGSRSREEPSHIPSTASDRNTIKEEDNNSLLSHKKNHQHSDYQRSETRNSDNHHGNSSLKTSNSGFDETWYETEMFRYKPDIMQFVARPEHAVFRNTWNSYLWREQFKRSIYDKSINNNTNQTSRLLRMTVMLNTIGVIRKTSYMSNNREIKLRINNKMKTIVYDHESKLARGGKMSMSAIPYKLTTVEVVKGDYLAAYDHLVKSDKRPLLLNMASASTPGSGYRTGHEGHEENLFRRSDYFRSLDIEVDGYQEQPSDRFYCTSDCQLNPIDSQKSIYPMDEFGAIYTSGVTIFRQLEDNGYAYMEKPLENVCILAMAAYEDPQLQDNMLAKKYAVGMRKKIENIFAIAYHHKHDSLVLSTFGCGTDKNLADRIVKLFSSVIEQYAGFFKTIIFVIPDDYSVDHNLNSKENFRIFQAIDGTVESIKPVNKPNIMFGPYRILSEDGTVSDICICDKYPCQFGATCSGINNKDHIQEFSHPPLCMKACVTGKCDLTTNPVHMYFYIHQKQCPDGGECQQINNEKHRQEFQHPSYCPSGGTCENMSEKHLKEYRHLPLCKDSHKCNDFRRRNKLHCNAYRHCALHCQYKYYCADFHDRKHMRELQHPFAPPCPFTPYHCHFYIELTQSSETQRPSQTVEQHCLDYSHVCRFGRNCVDTNAVHMEKSIHVARCICPHGDTCLKLNQEEHLNSYTHPNILDIRRICKHSDKCHDRQRPEHIIKFRHDVHLDDTGVVGHFHLNKDTDFVRNQAESIARVKTFIENQKWEPLSPDTIPREILDWVRTVQPVHRCNPVIFESIILHGHVMSRSYMDNLKKPYFVAKSVLQHSRIRLINDLHIPTIKQQAVEYITALVRDEFEKSGVPKLDQTTTPATGTTNRTFLLTTSSSLGDEIKKKENFISASISTKDIDALRRTTIEIAQASIKLHSNPAGIGYEVDTQLGTDKTIFSVLGPHLGHYYGDVVIIFKREILHHPDANFSIQAATSFASGKAYSWRPWLGTDPASKDERIKLFHHSKLHASVPGYDIAAALELMAITSSILNKKSMNIDFNTIIERWTKVDSHQTIEAHLPQLIPLDYIEHIYMPKNIYENFNQATLKSINAVFRNRMTITEHEGETDQAKWEFGPTPPTELRAEYQDFVVKELIKRFCNRTENSLSRPIKGAAITISPSDFRDHCVLPLTIAQAYKQYCIDYVPSSTDDTIYIYWQVLKGDMMLTLSNERIDLSQGQSNLSCLVCYVAQTPEPSSSHYHEQASYLNKGTPFQHDKIIQKHTYAASSDTFYIGCNTGDFLTFCLEIQRSTGKVTLSHAGSNLIYNREIITHTFDKSELDLSKLEFVHVSAGKRIAPIRNLMIWFEKQPDLHPTSDKQFKIDSNPIDVDDQDSPLIPCPNNVNCLLQLSANETTHNSKYSHPCRFSELCRNHEPYLTHEPHQVPNCQYDDKCDKLIDPIHRASYRHTGWPDFLIPCRFKQECHDRSGKHRIRYSHGELVYNISEKPTIPCKWGSICRELGNQQHCEEYSHSSKPQHHHEQIPCKWSSACWEIGNQQHCEKYSHSSKSEHHHAQIPCKWGSQCRTMNDPNHVKRYSHSKTDTTSS
ncbi:unnamed protein product [Adineta steineri]|uniref:RING-type domain-containing protein n=1 Tax=Adineta steineri TaxID=433720 RepID=A0A818HY46_9BILA|nr:unnamed protein product [Adineta steineri]